MAVVAIKSEEITDAEAQPVVLTAGPEAHGRLMQKVAKVTVNASLADSAASTYRIGRIPTTATGISIEGVEALAATSLVHLGLYYVNTNGAGLGTVLDDDYFATSVALSALTDVALERESTTYGLTDWTKPLWDAVGLTSDPGGVFELVMTSVGAVAPATATADVGFKVRWSD